MTKPAEFASIDPGVISGWVDWYDRERRQSSVTAGLLVEKLRTGAQAPASRGLSGQVAAVSDCDLDTRKVPAWQRTIRSLPETLAIHLVGSHPHRSADGRLIIGVAPYSAAWVRKALRNGPEAIRQLEIVACSRTARHAAEQELVEQIQSELGGVEIDDAEWHRLAQGDVETLDYTGQSDERPRPMRRAA